MEKLLTQIACKFIKNFKFYLQGRIKKKKVISNNIREMRAEMTATSGLGGTVGADDIALKNEVNRLQLELMRSKATPATNIIYR